MCACERSGGTSTGVSSAGRPAGWSAIISNRLPMAGNRIKIPTCKPFAAGAISKRRGLSVVSEKLGGLFWNGTPGIKGLRVYRVNPILATTRYSAAVCALRLVFTPHIVEGDCHD